jgi:hypothetical protein
VASVRLVTASPADRPVLTGRAGRLRGEVTLRNVSAKPVRFGHAEVHAEIGKSIVEIRPPTSAPAELEPEGEGSVLLSASLDRLTPPGTYKADVVIEGSTLPVTLIITEEIALTLSQTELVVIAGQDAIRSVAMHNLGNVPLAVSQIGPADLEVDVRRPTLLQRIGMLPVEDPVQPVVDECCDDTDEKTEKPVQTVTARLKTPIIVAPGETVVGDWIVTTEGPLEAGLRYRAVAPLYTTDIGFVVTPAQDAPPAPKRAKRAAAKRKESP